jgi:hypothetical protein
LRPYADDPALGFNRRKLEDQRREAGEKEADGLRRGVDRRFALTRRGSCNFSCRGFTGPSG